MRSVLILLLLAGLSLAGFFAGRWLSAKDCPPTKVALMQEEMDKLERKIPGLKKELDELRQQEGLSGSPAHQGQAQQ